MSRINLINAVTSLKLIFSPKLCESIAASIVVRHQCKAINIGRRAWRPLSATHALSALLGLDDKLFWRDIGGLFNLAVFA